MFIKRTILLAILLCCTTWAQANLIEDLTQLVSQQQYIKAYDLAKRHEAQYFGLPKFDYLYGLAALHTGHPDAASFAFDRVLTRYPNNAGAYYHNGVAYAQMNNPRAARANFLAVLNANATKTLKENAQQYLTSLDNNKGGRSLRGYIKVAGGYTSNANSATSDQIINVIIANVPIAVTLASTARAQETLFSDLQAGLSAYYPLNETLRVFANLDGSTRYHPSANNPSTVTGPGKFNTHSGTAIVGVSLALTPYRISLPIRYQMVNLDRGRYRNLLTFSGQVSRPIGQNDLAGLYAEGSRATYPTNSPQNAKLYSGGVLWKHQFKTKPIVASLKTYYGQENPEGANLPFVQRKLFGADLGFDWRVNHALTPYTLLSTSRSLYHGIVPGFVNKRADLVFDWILGAHVKLSQRWQLQPSYSYLNNDSNTAIYSYRRHEFNLALTYSFDNWL